MSWIYLIGAIATNAIANLFIKKASLGSSFLEAPSIYFFLIGTGLFAINLILYTFALKTFSLPTGYAILIGGSIILITISSHFLGEPLTAMKVTGIILIFTGITLATQ